MAECVKPKRNWGSLKNNWLPKARTGKRSSKKKWMLKTSLKLFHAGQVFLFNACCKANVRSCCTWKLNCTNVLSARKKRLLLSVMQYAAAVRGFRISASPSVHSSFLVQQALVKQS